MIESIGDTASGVRVRGAGARFHNEERVQWRSKRFASVSFPRPWSGRRTRLAGRAGGRFRLRLGVAPVNPETGKVEITDIATQTTYVLENVKACLEAAGSSLEKVVKANVLIANSAYYGTVNEIYARYFPTIHRRAPWSR